MVGVTPTRRRRLRWSGLRPPARLFDTGAAQPVSGVNGNGARVCRRKASGRFTLKSDSILFLFVLCLVALGAAACGGDSSPTTPTPAPPAPVTLTGVWVGPVDGQLISSDSATADLAQSASTVTGEWSATVRLPPVPGAPAEVPLGGPVTGTATGATAELAFAIVGFPTYFAEGCAIDVSVTSFDQTTMQADWTTNDMCQPPAVDSGTLTFTRQ